MSEENCIAEVLLSRSLDKGLDYYIPPVLRNGVRPGVCVRVTLRGAEVTGYVVKLKSRSDFPAVKSILRIEDSHEQIPKKLLALADWISDYYCCPREHALRVLLPSVVRSGEMRHKQLTFVSLTFKAISDISLESLTPRQKAVVELLKEEGTMSLTDLLEQSGSTAAVVARLETLGYIEKEKRVVERDPFMNDIIQPDKPKELTRQQEEALTTIKASIEAKNGDVILLHGVTASGKTEVYLQAISRCLELGLEAIVLVPEISLTPQTCDRFRQRFGNLVSVLHSALSDGERYDEWTRINDGRSKIAIGARSALFAPFRNLGLIVVDEEHETTYKQEDSPRYNARDIAVVRGKLEKAAVLLGSATPSLESYYNCMQGRYKLVEMRERIDRCVMPTIELVDLSEESAEAGMSKLFSRRLVEMVNDRLYKGEQVMLFLNRRGYATQMICQECGYVSICENCSVAHTYHKRAGELVCHLCGDVKRAPEKCPQCGSDGIKYTGVGTEKVESIAKALFPMAKVARMDSDTMTAKDSYRKVLDDFRTGKVQILIGTQMIAKGLDFPNVTLVGVLNADSGLHIPDFRSGERTFQLLTQVAGRAGRGYTPGLVLIQTYNPKHFVLQSAIDQNYRAFYDEEMPSRQALGFPPVSHAIMIHFRSQEEAKAREAAEEFAKELTPQLESAVKVIGPMPSPLSKVKAYFRYQMLLYGGNPRPLIRTVRKAVLGKKPKNGVDIYADVDPRNLC